MPLPGAAACSSEQYGLVKGLTEATHLNGKAGKILNFDSSKGLGSIFQAGSYSIVFRDFFAGVHEFAG